MNMFAVRNPSQILSGTPSTAKKGRETEETQGEGDGVEDEDVRYIADNMDEDDDMEDVPMEPSMRGTLVESEVSLKSVHRLRSEVKKRRHQGIYIIGPIRDYMIILRLTSTDLLSI